MKIRKIHDSTISVVQWPTLSLIFHLKGHSVVHLKSDFQSRQLTNRFIWAFLALFTQHMPNLEQAKSFHLAPNLPQRHLLKRSVPNKQTPERAKKERYSCPQLLVLLESVLIKCFLKTLQAKLGKWSYSITPIHKRETFSFDNTGEGGVWFRTPCLLRAPQLPGKLATVRHTRYKVPRIRT